MTDTHYPQSVRQALAYLDVNPLVCMVTRYAQTIIRSHRWYVGVFEQNIWFEPYPVGPERAPVGLCLVNSEAEVGFLFDPAGFEYHRGHCLIRVNYANTLEALS